jgi:hypothetical protein
MQTGWTPLDATVVHVFTHFRLTLSMSPRKPRPKGFGANRKALTGWRPRDFAEPRPAQRYDESGQSGAFSLTLITHALFI